jgi:hypothetical protein
MAQVVVHLPSKCEALSLSPISPKKQTKNHLIFLRESSLRNQGTHVPSPKHLAQSYKGTLFFFFLK